MRATEHTITMPVSNPDTGRTSRTWLYAGVLDLLDNDVLVDWKSVSDTQRFIMCQTIGVQGELYALALAAAGTPIREVCYRLVTRPGIKYCGKDKRDPEAYEQRCVEWLDQPSKVAEHVAPMNETRLLYASRWLWCVAKRIREAQLSDVWLTNESACGDYYGKPCPYSQLCFNEAVGADNEWEITDRFVGCVPHPELGDIDPGDKQVITYSAAKQFCSCERRYYWRYERLLKVRTSDSDAVWSGSAMHAGLDGLATGGIAGAVQAIEDYAERNPVLGEDAGHKQDQECAKARAMVRVAAERWV